MSCALKCCCHFYSLCVGCFVIFTHLQAGKVILTLPLCVSYKTHVWRTLPRSSISSFFCESLYPFVHLLVTSPGIIHSERPSWHFTTSPGTLVDVTGQNPDVHSLVKLCEDVFLVFSLFVLYFCYHIRRHDRFDSTFLKGFYSSHDHKPFQKPCSCCGQGDLVLNCSTPVMNKMNLFSILFQNKSLGLLL